MAISSGSVMKRPKVVEESDNSDSDGNQTTSEEEQELESGDMEIKEEVDDEYLQESNLGGECFTAYSNDEDFLEIKEEEVDEYEEERRGNENKMKKTKTKKTKCVTFAEPDSDSDDSDDMNDEFMEGKSENEEDNYGDDESEKEEGKDKKNVGSGLANVMAKILGTKKSEGVILSKAKTDREVKESMKTKKEDTFEIVDSSGQVKEEPLVEKMKEEEDENEKSTVTLHDRELHRKLWEEKFRKKPSIIEDKERERRLRVLATQGVVQLFSAIEKHKNMMQIKLSQCRSIMGREKVLEGTGKEAFLDILKQQGKRVKKETDGDVNEEVKEEPVNLQPPVKKKPKWNVFSDNFYKEPTLHGWDQQSDDGDD